MFKNFYKIVAHNNCLSRLIVSCDCDVVLSYFSSCRERDLESTCIIDMSGAKTSILDPKVEHCIIVSSCRHSCRVHGDNVGHQGNGMMWDTRAMGLCGTPGQWETDTFKLGYC